MSADGEEVCDGPEAAGRGQLCAEGGAAGGAAGCPAFCVYHWQCRVRQEQGLFPISVYSYSITFIHNI